MRKIKVINANLGKVRIVETDSITWGEFKALISDMFSGNVKAVVRETEVSLESDGALLPEGSFNDHDDYDFTLFIVTKESKAGSDAYDDDSFWSFHQLRREVSNRGGSNVGLTRSQLINFLRDKDDAENTDQAFNVSVISIDSFDSLEDKIDDVMSAIRLIAFDLGVDLDDNFEDRSEITQDEMEDYNRFYRSL